MGHYINHLEEKIKIAKMIEEAINKLELPEGYVIETNSASIMHKPTTQFIAMVHSNRKPKGGYDTHIDLQ